MSSNTFCKHLSNGYRFYIEQGKITYHPCCQWEGPRIDFHKETLVQQRTLWNSDIPWGHLECNRCGKEEPVKGEYAYRKAGNKIIPVLPQNKVAWLDIQADMTCNGGCLICGPWNSSFWQSELKKYGKYTISPVKSDLPFLVNSIFDSIDTSELKLLQFLGGEPFLSELDGIGINRLSNPNQCTLKYTTNGSIFPKADRIEQWKQFNKVFITLSIDAIGDRFDYLRYPLKWDSVQKNIHRMLNELPSNVEFTINHSITPLNILYYNEFLQWVQDTFKMPPRIHCHPAYGIMNPNNGGLKLKAMVAAKYGAGHQLVSMIQSNSVLNIEFLEYINQWDHRRKTSWSKSFPNMVAVLPE